MLIGIALEETGDGQPTEVQQLRDFGCDRVIVSAQHARIADDVFDYLRQDDILVVADLSRLAGSIRDLIEVGRRLNELGVSLHTLHGNIQPETPVGAAFGPLCSILTEFCRNTEAANQGKPRRSHKGRPAALNPEERKRAKRLLERTSVLEVARMLKVSPATIYRYFPRRRPSVGHPWRSDHHRSGEFQGPSPPRRK